MKKRRLLSLVVACVTAVNLLCLPAYAAPQVKGFESVSEIIGQNAYQAKPGEGYDSILENAKTSSAPVGSAVITNNDGTEHRVVDVYAADTSATFRSNDNEYSITYIASVKADDLQFSDLYRDPTLSATFYMTVFYAKNLDNYIKMTKITGRIDRQQSGLQITNQKLVYRQMSAYVGVEEFNTYNPSGDSFTRSTGFKNYVPDVTGATQVFGATWTATLTKGGSSWGIEFMNHKYL